MDWRIDCLRLLNLPLGDVAEAAVGVTASEEIKSEPEGTPAVTPEVTPEVVFEGVDEPKPEVEVEGVEEMVGFVE
jgi:hypothetical protein